LHGAADVQRPQHLCPYLRHRHVVQGVPVKLQAVLSVRLQVEVADALA
jgi:hypothetical protein